eukprot:1185304-Prorocentrum_minimum.AAC.2
MHCGLLTVVDYAHTYSKQRNMLYAQRVRKTTLTLKLRLPPNGTGEESVWTLRTTLGEWNADVVEVRFSPPSKVFVGHIALRRFSHAHLHAGVVASSRRGRRNDSPIRRFRGPFRAQALGDAGTTCIFTYPNSLAVIVILYCACIACTSASALRTLHARSSVSTTAFFAPDVSKCVVSELKLGTWHVVQSYFTVEKECVVKGLEWCLSGVEVLAVACEGASGVYEVQVRPPYITPHPVSNSPLSLTTLPLGPANITRKYYIFNNLGTGRPVK